MKTQHANTRTLNENYGQEGVHWTSKEVVRYLLLFETDRIYRTNSTFPYFGPSVATVPTQFCIVTPNFSRNNNYERKDISIAATNCRFRWQWLLKFSKLVMQRVRDTSIDYRRDLPYRGILNERTWEMYSRTVTKKRRYEKEIKCYSLHMEKEISVLHLIPPV